MLTALIQFWEFGLARAHTAYAMQCFSGEQSEPNDWTVDETSKQASRHTNQWTHILMFVCIYRRAQHACTSLFQFIMSKERERENRLKCTTTTATNEKMNNKNKTAEKSRVDISLRFLMRHKVRAACVDVVVQCDLPVVVRSLVCPVPFGLHRWFH